MADFSFLSDSDDEKAVQELLSQAMDQSVLEQVAAINCAGFTDSNLPTHLETRFRKLKSLPARNPNPPNITPTSKSFNLSQFADQGNDLNEKSNSNLTPTSKSFDLSEPVDLGKDLNGKSSSDLEDLSGLEKNPDPDPDFDPKSKSGSSSFSLDSPEPVSPPAKTGCFWCSPKKVLSRGKENRGIRKGFDWGKSDAEFLSDLSSFSKKNQEKMLKKSMKEEEKICREAEKIVEWAKQASARMDFNGLDDVLSDNDSHRR